MSTVMAEVIPTQQSTAAVRLQHLQILRVLAASLVVVDHTFSSLKPMGIRFPTLDAAGDIAGSLGVSVFFVISGLIMVRHSAERFGSLTYPFVFACHRLIRIAPIYWIASIVWSLGLIRSGFAIPFAGKQFFLSMAFIPDYLSGQYRLNPLLGPGWTLNYEMAFYLLFALSLFLPRRFGIGALLAVIGWAALWGASHFRAQTNTPGDLLRFYTDRVILLFAAGVLLGAVEILLKRPTPFRLPISPAFLILLPTAAILWRPMHFDAYAWPGLAGAFALVALCTLTANQAPGWFTRTLVLLGDASYSTYLFHLWVFAGTNALVVRVYSQLHQSVESPFAFMAAAVLGANLLGLTIHLLLERPITSALRQAIAYTFGGRGTFSPVSSTSKLST